MKTDNWYNEWSANYTNFAEFIITVACPKCGGYVMLTSDASSGKCACGKRFEVDDRFFTWVKKYNWRKL